MMYVQTIGGLLMLLFAGDLLVRSSVDLAHLLRVPSFIVGLTVVAFGTSAPELSVSVTAALGGSGGIAVGNVVGSNIANVLMVAGIPALLIPMAGDDDEDMTRDYWWMMVATVMFLLFGRDGVMQWREGFLFLVLFLVFLAETIASARRHAADHAHEPEIPAARPFVIFGTLLVSLGLLVFAASQLVEGASGLARLLGVSETVIGLTVVAVGTSFPELATSLMAAIRHQGGVALGNIIGSNLFNLMLVLGAGSLIRELPIDSRLMAYDVWVMLGVAVLMGPYVLRRHGFGRVAGLVLSSAFVIYIAAQFNGLPALFAGGAR